MPTRRYPDVMAVQTVEPVASSGQPPSRFLTHFDRAFAIRAIPHPPQGWVALFFEDIACASYDLGLPRAVALMPPTGGHHGPPHDPGVGLLKRRVGWERRRMATAPHAYGRPVGTHHFTRRHGPEADHRTRDADNAIGAKGRIATEGCLRARGIGSCIGRAGWSCSDQAVSTVSPAGVRASPVHTAIDWAIDESRKSDPAPPLS